MEEFKPKNEGEDRNYAKLQEIRRKRELGSLIKNQVIKTITDQQRPGGLLSSAKYKLSG